jgi:hypothetical protein
MASAQILFKPHIASLRSSDLPSSFRLVPASLLVRALLISHLLSPSPLLISPLPLCGQSESSLAIPLSTSTRHHPSSHKTPSFPPKRPSPFSLHLVAVVEGPISSLQSCHPLWTSNPGAPLSPPPTPSPPPSLAPPPSNPKLTALTPRLMSPTPSRCLFINLPRHLPSPLPPKLMPSPPSTCPNPSLTSLRVKPHLPVRIPTLLLDPRPSLRRPSSRARRRKQTGSLVSSASLSSLLPFPGISQTQSPASCLSIRCFRLHSLAASLRLACLSCQLPAERSRRRHRPPSNFRKRDSSTKPIVLRYSSSGQVVPRGSSS